MSLTQFAMVEELAFLVKDNIPCKHLVMSMEEVLVNFLQDNTSLGGVLELEPMNPYERLLIHRLAEIFGFSHQSVGEGEDRHLILERCSETSMPSVLVTDLLWQSGEVQSPMTFDVLRRKKVTEGQRDVAASESSLEGRETDYHVARASADMYRTEEVKHRPRNDPVVARRMIAHALGKTNKVMSQECNSSDTKENESTAEDQKIQQVGEGSVCSGNEQDSKSQSAKQPRPCILSQVRKCSASESSSMSNVVQQDNLALNREGSAAEKQKNNIRKNHLRKEHMGAAKRLFANALGIQQKDINQSKCNITKKTDG